MHNIGYQFEKWSGLSSSTSNVTKINLSHDGKLIAHFNINGSSESNLIFFLSPSYLLSILASILAVTAGVVIIRWLVKWRVNKYKKYKQHYMDMIENSTKSLKGLYKLEEKFTGLFIEGRMSFSLYQEINNKVSEYIREASNSPGTDNHVGVL